jgi:hypothetical protein
MSRLISKIRYIIGACALRVLVLAWHGRGATVMVNYRYEPDGDDLR